MPTGTTPFTIGQTIFVVDQDYTEIPCRSCEGRGSLYGKDDLPVTCPTCRGEGVTLERGPWRVMSPQTLTKMEIEEDCITVEYKPNGWIGVPLEQVFEAFDEALADAKRRNAEEGEGA